MSGSSGKERLTRPLAGLKQGVDKADDALQKKNVGLGFDTRRTSLSLTKSMAFAYALRLVSLIMLNVEPGRVEFRAALFRRQASDPLFPRLDLGPVVQPPIR